MQIKYYNLVEKVGVEKLANNLVNVYLPIGINEEDVKDDVDFLNKLIFTVSVAKRKEMICNGNIVNNKDLEWPIYSELWLIRDFLSFGLYRNIEKHFVVNSNGKINWKRTIKTKAIIEKDMIYYPKIIYEKNTNVTNIITEIHKYCINTCFFGRYIYNLDNLNFDLNINISEDNKQYYLNILKKELNISFEDHKKMLINSMINILTNSSDNNEMVLNSFVTYEYHYAWETMISKIFKDDEDLKKSILPKATYILNEVEKKSSSLEPDTVFKDSNIVYIIDSKYYYDGLPKTSDVCKQLQYGASVMQKYNKISNSFILPTKQKDFLIYKGYAIIEDKNKFVNVIYANTIDVINKFYNSEYVKDLSILSKRVLNRTNI